MRRRNQKTLFKQTEKGRAQGQVEYVPPAPEIIDKYAYTVCRALGKKDGKYQHNTEFVRGFAAFVNVVTRVTAKQLNRGVEPCPAKK